MNRIFAIIKSNLKGALDLKQIFIINLIFICIFRMKIDYFNKALSFNEYINVIFYGPISLFSNMLDTLIWSTYEFYLIYIIGNYLYRELKGRSIYTISRIGSRLKWYTYIQVTVMSVCFIYYSIAIFIVGICVYVLNGQVVIVNMFGILNILLILTLSGYLIMNMYIVAVMVLRNHNLTFLLIVVLLYLLIEVGYTWQVDMYIPFNHGILGKRIIGNINFIYSYVYLIIMSFISIWVVRAIIVKNDLLDIID